MSTTDLQARLRKTRIETYRPLVRVLNNPDGPEAATALATLEAEAAALRAERDELRKERDEAERQKINWFECHLAHRDACAALGRANGELLRRAMDAEARAALAKGQSHE